MVQSQSGPTTIASYDTIDYSRSKPRTGTTKWRVVQGTGNCCENYLTSTNAGRLLDFGGSYVNYTDDRGLHWKQVQPATPLVNGEGTLDLAPNGDVIAIGWDPYSWRSPAVVQIRGLLGQVVVDGGAAAHALLRP